MQIGPGIIGALAAGNSSTPPEQNIPSKATVLKLLPAANPNAPKVYVPVSSTLERLEKGAEALPKFTPPKSAAQQGVPSVAATVQQSAPAHTSSHGNTPTATAISVASSTKPPQVSTKPGHPRKIPVVTVPQYPQSQLILIEQKTTNPSPGPGKQTQQIVHSPKLVEIISTCNWDSARNLILKMIAQQSQSLTLPRVFQVADFFVEVMGPSQERRIYNLPANLLQTLPPRIQSARVKIWKQAPLKAGKPIIIVPPPTPQAEVKATPNPDDAVQNQAVPMMGQASEADQQADAAQKEVPTAKNIQVKLTAEQAKQKLSKSTAVSKEAKLSTLQEDVPDVPSEGDVSAVGNVLDKSPTSNSNSQPPTPEKSEISTVESEIECSAPGRDDVDVSGAESSVDTPNTATGPTASSKTVPDKASASSEVQGALSDDMATPARSLGTPLIPEKSSGERGESETLTHDESEGAKEEVMATEGADKCERQEAAQSSGSYHSDDTPTSTKIVTTTAVANHDEGKSVSTKPVTPTRLSISSDSAFHVPSTKSEGKLASLLSDDVKEKQSLSKEAIAEDKELKQPMDENTTENNASLETTEEGNILSDIDATLQKQSQSQVEMKSLDPPENLASSPIGDADDVARETEAGEAKLDTQEREEDTEDSKSAVVQEKLPCIQQKDVTEGVSVDSGDKEQESASQTGHNKDADSIVDNDLDHNPSTTVTRQTDSSQENQSAKVLTSGTFIPENPLDSLITRVAASIASAEKAGNVDPAKRVTSTGTFVPENPLLEADESESSEESDDGTSSSDSSSRKGDLSSEEDSAEAVDESPETPVDSTSVEESKEVSEPKVDTADDKALGTADDKAIDQSDNRIMEMVPKESSKESEDSTGGSHAAEKPEKTESPKKIATSGIFVPTVATDEQNQWLENQATHTSTDQHHETIPKEQNKVKVKEGEEALSNDQGENGEDSQDEVLVASSEEDNVDVDGLQAPSSVQKRKADTDLVDIVDDDEEDDTPAAVKLRLSIAASGEVINPQCSVHSLKAKKKRKSVMEEFEPDDVEFIEKGREELMAEAAEAKKTLLDRRLGVSRLLHISNERRRRKEIKDLFGNLKALLGIPREDDRVANIHVLRKSKEVIDKLKRDENRLTDVKLHLLSQREKLIKRIASSPQSMHSEAELHNKFMLPSEEPGFFDDKSMSCDIGGTKTDSESKYDSRSERTERPPKITLPQFSQIASISKRTDRPPRVAEPQFSPIASSSKRKESPPKLSQNQSDSLHVIPDASQEESSVLQQEFLKQLDRLKKGEELPEPEVETEDKMMKTAVKDTAHPEMEIDTPRAKPVEKETQDTNKRKLNEEDGTKRTDAQGGRLRKKARKSTFRKTNVNKRTITPQQLSNLEQTHPSRNNDTPSPGKDIAKSQDLPDSHVKTASSKEDNSPAPDSSRPSKSSAEGTSSPGIQTFKIQGGLVKSLTTLAAAGAKKPNILRTTRPQTPTQSQETTDSTNMKGGSVTTSTSCVKMSASGIEIVPAGAPKAATITNVPILQLSSNAPRGQPIFLENCDFLPAGGVIAVPIQGASSSTTPAQGVAHPITTAGQVHLTSTKTISDLVPAMSTVGNAGFKQAIKVVSVASSPILSSSSVASQKEPATSNTAIKFIQVGSSKGIGQAMRFSVLDKKTSLATPVAMVSSVTSTTAVTSVSPSATKSIPAITMKPLSVKECQVMKSPPRVVTLPVGTVFSSKVQGQVHVPRTGPIKLAPGPAPAKLAPAPAKLAPAPAKLAPAPAKLAPAPAKIAPAPTKIAPAPTKIAPAKPAPAPKEDVTPVKEDLSRWTTLQMEQDDESGFLTAKMKLKGAGMPRTRNGPRASPTACLEGATSGVVSECKKPNAGTQHLYSGTLSPTAVLQKIDGRKNVDTTVESEDSSNSSASKATEADQLQTGEKGDSKSTGTHSAAKSDVTEQEEVSTA
ncbi:mucin-17-like [Branchiostoma floridae]|uniref:Mucin-17-like n=1 Tax=Branchiostoma floridae TaxID=7739 RepID=A0A9J7LEF1_BRAFL|nr:mucin-17-like [Branchiostoma floridae]